MENEKQNMTESSEVQEMETQTGFKDEEVFSTTPAVMNYLIVAVIFFAVGMAVGFFAFGSDASALTATDVDRIVRDAIADADLSGGANDERFDLVDDDPYLGDPDAAVVIVEFSDFRCPYCGRHFDQTLQPLLENYGDYIRYVYRDFANLSQESVTSAMASQCANEQGKYWEFHNALFTNQERLGPELDMEIAENLELDMDAFTACVEDERYASEVRADRLDGQLNGVSGTPGFFINGQFISGAQPYELFELIVQRELDKAGIDYAGEDA